MRAVLLKGSDLVAQGAAVPAVGQARAFGRFATLRTDLAGEALGDFVDPAGGGIQKL